jgi:hypothetical protein
MKKLIFLTFGFIVIILAGYFLNENVKKITAASLGYDSHYLPGYARYMFYSNSILPIAKSIREEYRKKGDTTEAFLKDKKFLKLIKTDERNLACIELSGVLFTLLVSISSLLFWLNRRKKNKVIEWFDWLALIASLFYMREIVVMSIDLFYGGKLCSEAKLWSAVGLHWYYADWICFVLGILWLIFMVIKVVPAKSRIIFFISGFLGSITGFLLIVYFVGRYLL